MHERNTREQRRQGMKEETHLILVTFVQDENECPLTPHAPPSSTPRYKNVRIKKIGKNKMNIKMINEKSGV